MEDHFAELARQLRHFRTDRRFTDLTFKCNGGQEVLVHRAVLASCSDFLAGLLRDKEEAVLILPDCTDEEVLGLVQVRRDVLE